MSRCDKKSFEEKLRNNIETIKSLRLRAFTLFTWILKSLNVQSAVFFQQSNADVSLTSCI